MSISELFKSVNSDIREEDLFPASLITDEQKLKEYEEQTGFKLSLYSEICILAEKLGFNPQHVYFVNHEKSFSAYYYFEFPVFVEIPQISEEAFQFMQVMERIKKQSDICKELMEKNDYKSIISFVDSKIRIMAMNKLYHIIPDEDRYTWFLEVYTLEDYGLQNFTPGLIEDAFSKRTESVKKILKEKLDAITDNDDLTIYKGVLSQSTPLDKAYSWTLSLSVAAFFAGRFGMQGDIFSAKVKKKDVIDYITYRREEEILVRPENIYDIKNVELIKGDEELKVLTDTGYLFDYHHFVNQLDDNLFFNPHGIHGLLHIKRVLLHVLSLCREFELDDTDKNLLAIAAIRHDIGRINDEKDDYHGKRSWEKLKQNNMIEEIEFKYEIYDADMELLQCIIENHCLDDDVCWKKLSKIKSYRTYEEMELLVKIFKDADGLDRVRLGDLDVNYLRLEESKRRVLFARYVLEGIQ